MPLAVVILLAVGCDWSMALLHIAEKRGAEAALAVEMVTDPPAEQILPDTRPAQLTFKVLVDGKPSESGRLALQVMAPPRPVLLSTPFPAVEGTTLLQLASNLTDGEFTLEYLFPVQGVYAFDIGIEPVSDGQPGPPTWLQQRVRVHADPASIRRAWLSIVMLFCLGGIAGAWYARSAHMRKNPPAGAAIGTAILVLGTLVFVTGTFTFADHGPRELMFPQGVQVIQGDDGWALEVRPTPEQAAVGELMEFTVTLTHEGQVFPGPIDVAIHLYNLKDDQTVLRTNVRAPRGSISQRFQVIESVPHTCTITARAVSAVSGSPIMLTAVIGIDVVAAPTPITVKLRVMGLVVGVVGAGMVSGFWLASGVRQRSGKVEP
jgi:hypothetical protein